MSVFLSPAFHCFWLLLGYRPFESGSEENMEKDASASQGQIPATGAENLYSGDVYTDEVLMKAGAENIEDVHVANVQLVRFLFNIPPFQGRLVF